MAFDESALALRAQEDERAREELIHRSERNILRIASRAKHRFVSKSDDEWAIALCAFSRAIDTYSSDKGRFLPYAETLIRRSLIDVYRAEKKRAIEISVPPESFEGETEEDAANPVLAVIVRSSLRAQDTALRDEILAANAELKRFGFSFYDLTSCSPGRAGTRGLCFRAADAVLSSEPIRSRLLKTGQLPMRFLTEMHGIQRKLLDRYRRYIIALIVIRCGDYPALNGYIRGIRGE